MTTRKAIPSLLYTNSRSIGWVRTLSAFIDEGMAALCMRQWQRALIPVVQRPNPPVAPRRAR